MATVFRILIVAASTICARAADLPNPWFSPPDNAQFLHGHFVYQKNCVPCHGRRGDGEGDMGLTVRPRPRNFTSGTFKYRSTPSGAMPADEDLERTIRHGIAGTAMPAFTALPARDVRAVINYVKTFSPKWKERANFAAPIRIPDQPAWFGSASRLSQYAEKGRVLFASMCSPCHGENGAGNGPSSGAMVDSWGHPIVPADLRQSSLRSGGARRDLYRVLVTGVDGTPMPSFAESISEEQRWELVAHIEQLRRGFARANASRVE